MPERPGKPSRPPKAYWSEMYRKIKSGNPDYTDEQIRKTIGSIWYGLTPKKRREILRRYEKSEEASKMDAGKLEEEIKRLIKRNREIDKTLYPEAVRPPPEERDKLLEEQELVRVDIEVLKEILEEKRKGDYLASGSNKASEMLAVLQPTFESLFKAMDEHRFLEELYGKKEEKKEEECPLMDKLKKMDKDMVNWIKEEIVKMYAEVKDKSQRGKAMRRIWKRARDKFKASADMPEKWEDFLPKKEQETYTNSDLLDQFKKYLGAIEKAKNDMIEQGKLSRGANSV